MDNAFKKKITPYLILTAIYLLSQFFVLILSGCWWDDWTFMTHNLDYVNQVAMESGRPEWNLLVPLCWSLPHNGRILIFFLYYLDSFLVFNILKNCGFFNEKDSLLITVLYLLIPVNDARILISNFAYTVGLFLFYLATALFIHWNNGQKKIVYRILLLVLFFCSLILNSLLTYFYIIIFYLFLLELKKAGRIDIKNIFKAVWEVIRHYPDFFVLPFVYFAYNKIFFPTYGPIYGNYNSINPLRILKGVISIPKYILQYGVEIVLSWIHNINVYSVVIIIVLMLLSLFFWKNQEEDKKDIYYSLKVIFAGFVITVLAMLAYVTLRGKMLEMNWTQGRDSILVPLGLALIAYAILKLIPTRIRNFILIPVLVLGVFDFNDLYLEWQKDYYYQLAMENRFDNEVIRDNDTFFLADLNESEVSSQRFYSLNANSRNVFGDETRLFIPKISNLYLLDDEEALKSAAQSLHGAYSMKDYDPEDPNLDAVIVYSCELSEWETIGLKYDEMFDRDKFNEILKAKGTMDVYVVEDDFTETLLSKYNEGALKGDEDILKLLEEYK